MMRPKLLSLIALVVASVVGVPWPSLAQQPIRIGSSLSLTGKYALQGGYGREGYLLCQKQVNQTGGVLGRSVEFVIDDDGSEEKTAVRLYEKLITEDKVDAVIGPYGGPTTDAVADVTEKHRKLMIAPFAAATYLWEKGRRYLIMVLSPTEGLPEGVLDLAARHGLKTLAVINEDVLGGKAAAKGASELAKKKGLELVFSETYPKGTADFSGLLNQVKAAKPDVFVAASFVVDDLVAITRRMRELDLNVKMLSTLLYGALPEYYQRLGKPAEYVYSASFWSPGLPGNQEFVTAYEKEFNRAPALQSGNGYAGCQLFVEAARRAGSLDSDKLREALLTLRTKTVLGDFAIDERGFQIGHKAIAIQWQDGKQVVVWPDGLVSGKPRLPTPPWGQR